MTHVRDGRPADGVVVRVRDARLEDAEALCLLSIRAITQSAARHYSPDQVAAWAGRRTVEGHRRMVQSTHMLVAVLGDEEIVGFSSLALEPLDGLVPGEIDQLFVDPDHGGRGIASSLLQALHMVAENSQLSELVTHASWRAVPVFEAAGFQRVEVESVSLDGQVLTRVRMRRVVEAGGD